MRKVIIIGGGIAGLTAGVYAQQSGFNTTIYENNSFPGGNSTCWRSKGYLFEGAMHWLSGSSPDSPVYPYWREVGALGENNPVHRREEFMSYLDGKQEIHLYRDIKKLESHLLETAPEEAVKIKRLIKDIKGFQKMSMPILDIKGVRMKKKTPSLAAVLFSMLGILPRIIQLNNITAKAYAGEFEHTGIRTLLNCIAGSEEFSATTVAFALGGFTSGDAGYPEGGSLRMAQNMAAAFERAGGDIQYRTKVDRVHVVDNEADGVMIDGVLHNADAVIITADTLTAVNNLFDKPLMEPWIQEMQKETKPLNCTFISLGIKADFKSVPAHGIVRLRSTFEYGGISHRILRVDNYAGVKGYAPDGCTALTCMILGDTYDEWIAAKRDGSYCVKKQELAERIIGCLSEMFPQVCGNVEVWDVATPVTYEECFGTWRGSWMSIMSPGSKNRLYPGKPDTIDSLYFAGQRLMLPGGLPIALTTGRQAVQYLCKDQDVVFQCGK